MPLLSVGNIILSITSSTPPPPPVSKGGGSEPYHGGPNRTLHGKKEDTPLRPLSTPCLSFIFQRFLVWSADQSLEMVMEMEGPKGDGIDWSADQTLQYTQVTPKLNPIYIQGTPKLHPIYTRLHLSFTHDVPKLHSSWPASCTQVSVRLRPSSTHVAPKLHT